MKPRGYIEVDVELDEALEEVRRWCSHLPHGCVHMTLVRHAGLDGGSRCPRGADVSLGDSASDGVAPDSRE
jgi:hypothetical protein